MARLFALLLLFAVSTRAAEFRPALPGYQFQFPRDHGSHGEFATEWWYYTGHLQDSKGREWGYQLTWFRTALAPKIRPRKSKWAARDVFFAHFALSDVQTGRFFFADRIARGTLNLAGASEAGSRLPVVWCGPWKLRFGGKTGESQSFRALARSDDGATQDQDFALDLSQIALKPPAIHGERGVSQKTAGLGRASHYYSFTRLQTRGTVRIGRENWRVEGQSWFDHEFGSNQMKSNQTGWDWFSLQLNDGRELMLYRLRLQNGGVEPLSSGSLIEKNGQTRHLKLADFRLEPSGSWKSSASGAIYPAKWKIEVPGAHLSLEIVPPLADQELRPRRSFGVAYWEGLVRATGTQNGQGYLEMTGYARPFGATF